MLITWKPCSIAHRRPATSTGPLPTKPSPSTRTLISSQSGAIDRMIPAHALPWPHTSPSWSSATTTCSSSVTVTVTDRETSPTIG